MDVDGHAPKLAAWRGIVATPARARRSTGIKAGLAAAERWLAEYKAWREQLPTAAGLELDAKTEQSRPREYVAPDPAVAVDAFLGGDPDVLTGVLRDQSANVLLPRTNQATAFVRQVHAPGCAAPLANVLTVLAGVVWTWDCGPDTADAGPAPPGPAAATADLAFEYAGEGGARQVLPGRMVSSLDGCFAKYPSGVPVVVLLDYRGLDLRYLSAAWNNHKDSTNVVALILLRPPVAARTGDLKLHFKDDPDGSRPVPVPVLSVHSGMPPLGLAVRMNERLGGVATVVPVCEAGNLFHPAREPTFRLSTPP